MQGNTNKLMLIVAGAIILILGISLINSNRRSRIDQYDANITVTSEAAENLDLEAVFELVKTVKNAEELEKELNQPDGINNIDLNQDGKVDFIKVTEYGDREASSYGFSLTTEPEKGQEQEIASIEIVKRGEEAEIEVRGNEQIYGNNYYYYGHHPVGSWLLWSYLVRPHGFYASPWYYSYYPRYYGSGYNRVSRTAYNQRTASVKSGSTATKTSSAKVHTRTNISNPNRGKTASSGITSRLRNPTSSQKAFRSRAAARTTRTRSTGTVRSTSRSRGFGGFGK